MSSKAIHYRHPVLGYHACGMGDRNKITMTDNPDEVTCKRCQGTITGKNSNRQASDRPKVAQTISIDANLTDALKDRAKSTGQTKTAIIEAALKQYLQ